MLFRLAPKQPCHRAGQRLKAGKGQRGQAQLIAQIHMGYVMQVEAIGTGWVGHIGIHQENCALAEREFCLVKRVFEVQSQGPMLDNTGGQALDGANSGLLRATH